MVTGIAHSAYMVADMAKTLDFYCGKLGFTHAFSLNDEDNNPWIEYVKVCDGQFLEFFYPAPDFETRSGSYMHLCLEVDDIHAATAKFESAGLSLRVKPNQGKDGNWQAWADDPDGNAIEIMQISPDSPQATAR